MGAMDVNTQATDLKTLAERCMLDLEYLCGTTDCSGYLEAFDEFRRWMLDDPAVTPDGHERVRSLVQQIGSAPPDFVAIAGRFFDHPDVQPVVAKSRWDAGG